MRIKTNLDQVWNLTELTTNLIMVAKLTDVAKPAGVSPTTVSRVINVTRIPV